MEGGAQSTGVPRDESDITHQRHHGIEWNVEVDVQL
jgi:hypothetical protein